MNCLSYLTRSQESKRSRRSRLQADEVQKLKDINLFFGISMIDVRVIRPESYLERKIRGREEKEVSEGEIR